MNQIVFTLTARCRDCYRCLRSCPVKAIRMEKGQAYVDEKRCIACGTCIRECPQQAKTFRHDIDVAQASSTMVALLRRALPHLLLQCLPIGRDTSCFSSKGLGFSLRGTDIPGSLPGLSSHGEKACRKEPQLPILQPPARPLSIMLKNIDPNW